MLRSLLVASILAFVPFFGSCASIISGSHDTISVTSTEKGTAIYVDGVLRGTDSVQAEVKRGSRHTIRGEKEGCQTVTFETSESWDATSLLGVLIDFGIVTVPLDFLIVGCWKTSPTLYTVSPVRVSSPPAPAPASAPLKP
jgi:hypothetical protein